MCTVVLLCWPGGVAARYAMPMTMGLAVVCGPMFERWRVGQPRVIASALFVCCLIFSGLLIRGWIVMPFWPHLFQASQIAGRAVAAHLQQRSGPLYVVNESAEYDMLVYVSAPVRHWMPWRLLPEELQALSRQNPRLQFVIGQELVSLKQPYRIEIYPIGATH